MRRFLVSTLGCAVMLAALGINAQETVAVNTAPVDRATGNGSMGMGDGLGDPPPRDGEDSERRGLDRDEDPKLNRKAEPGHGGNETDMEHRRRPTLGDD